jgi:hypothetical protein
MGNQSNKEFEALERERDRILEQVGALIGEKAKLLEHIKKLNAELGLPPGYPAEKLGESPTLKKLYLQGKVSKLFFLRLKIVAPTIGHLAGVSVSEIGRWKGIGPKLQNEFAKLKKEFNL